MNQLPTGRFGLSYRGLCRACQATNFADDGPKTSTKRHIVDRVIMLTPPTATDAALHRLQLVVISYHRLTGRHLVDERNPDLWQACWSAPRVIVAHGTEVDPIFFYGNALALSQFELDFEAFTQLRSRYSAEPLLREERAALLARVHEHGFIDDYAGVRIAASGKRFRIEQAVVWNVIDGAGRRHGQAATFDPGQPVP